MSPKDKSRLWQGLALILSLLGLAIIFSRFDFETVWQSLHKISLWALLLSFILACAVQFIGGWRTQILLKQRVSLRLAINSLLVGNFASAFLPLRMGEVLRAGMLKRKGNIPLATATSVILLSQVLDVFAIALMGAFLLFFLPAFEELRLIIPIIFLALFLLSIPTIFLLRDGKWRNWIKNERINAILDNLLLGLASLKDAKSFTLSIALSLLFWLGTALATWVLLPDLINNPSFLLALSVAVGGGVGRLMPALPGSIGTLDVAILLSLQVFGVDEGIAVLLVLLLRLRYSLSTALLGIVAAWLENTDFSQTSTLLEENSSS